MTMPREKQPSGLYKVVRMYQGGKRPHAVRGMNGVYREEAKAHCSSPESSSRTCTTAAGKARTAKYGAWFDGYEPIYRR